MDYECVLRFAQVGRFLGRIVTLDYNFHLISKDLFADSGFDPQRIVVLVFRRSHRYGWLLEKMDSYNARRWLSSLTDRQDLC